MTASWKAFATIDPFAGMTGSNPGKLQNLAGGQWVDVARYRDDITDPMNGEPFLQIPDTTEFGPFIEGLESCPKSGLHNPLKNNDRYVHLGRVCARAAALMASSSWARLQAGARASSASVAGLITGVSPGRETWAELWR